MNWYTFRLKLFPSLLLLTTATLTKAQVFGGNPPSVKWNQVNTPEAKVIFPAGMDSAGRRVANIIHRMNSAVQPTIGYKQKQISIILQNQNTISNAYVGLAPFRSEFYLTPDQNSFEIGSLNWADQLAIHEYRHVQQYNNFNVGLSHRLKVLFGEGGQALGNELAIPNWFFEGDAVYNETLVSQQGRGRIPYFFNGYRALWAAGKNYSYMKLRNGSYLDYTPDHYPLGYMLVSYGREKYGNDLWKNVTHDAAAYHSLFYPFQSAFEKQTGTDFTKFKTDAFNYFKERFGDQPLQGFKKNQHFIADQEYPAFVNDSATVYVKTTYNRRAAFVVKMNDAEKQVAIRDISLDNYFDYRDGKIVYAAYNIDPRWGYRTYNELVILDINTGEQHRITHKTRYFSPSFSPDGKMIVAVEVAPSGKSELHLLDAQGGKLIAVIPNQKQLFHSYPKFYKDHTIVSVARDSKAGNGLVLTDINTGKLSYLHGFNNNPISFPHVFGDSIFFTQTYGLKDRLFVINGKAEIAEIQDAAQGSSVGYYQPTVNNNKLAWVAPTAYGYRLTEVNRRNIQLVKALNTIDFPLADIGITTLSRDSATNVLAQVKDEPLPVTKYSKAYHLFNFHSLIPVFDDPNYTLSLVGQNVLNTFQSSLLFNYNRDEGYKELGFSAAYGGLYPYLLGSVDYVIDRKGYYNGSNVYWNETEARAGAQIPLTFTNGIQITGLTFGADVVYNTTNFQSAYRSLFADRSYTYLNNYITFSNRISQPKQNIYPRFAQSLTLNYKYAVTGIDANQFLASGTLYLPGFLVNHNVVVNGAFQQRNRNSVISFSNNFPFSRGYTAENLYQLEKVGLNYHFPIAYPDAGIANTIYISRLRGNLFFDYTHANDFYNNGADFKANFRTAGAELYFDTSWFNQVPITFGIRYSHLLDPDLFGGQGRNSIELIVPLTLF